MSLFRALLTAAVLMLFSDTASARTPGSLPATELGEQARAVVGADLHLLSHRGDRGSFLRDPFFSRKFHLDGPSVFLFQFGDRRPRLPRHRRLTDRFGGGPEFHFHFHEPPIVLFEHRDRFGFRFGPDHHGRHLGAPFRHHRLIEPRLGFGHHRPFLKFRLEFD